MAYVSKRGRRPAEYASKSSHVHVINSPAVAEFLAKCELPKRAEEISLDARLITAHEPDERTPSARSSPSTAAIANPGSNRVPIYHRLLPVWRPHLQHRGPHRPRVPALHRPDDMAKLKQLQRLELTLPVRNVSLKAENTLTDSVRKAVYDFFRTELEHGLESLRWFIFQEYAGDKALDHWDLARCPHCGGRNIPLWRNQILKDFTFKCVSCQETILLTDVFRLHEAIDNDIGAGGVLGYITTTIEQLIIVHLIRAILHLKPSLLGEFMFIKDGPLGFFGQTANMHRPMRALATFLLDRHNLYLAGLEKSGAFVEHADQIAAKLKPGQALILNNDHIYKYILPGQGDRTEPYAATSYYGHKLIFKSCDERMYVVTLPTRQALCDPTEADFPNWHTILTNIEKVRCDMYDDALFPVALVNKLVSLADHPSTRILTRFALDAMYA